MTVGQLLAVVAALTILLLASETLLAVTGLHRIRIGFFRWLAGIAGLIAGAHWCARHTHYNAQHIHYAALAFGVILTAMWFTQPAPLPAARASRATGSTGNSQSTAPGS